MKSLQTIPATPYIHRTYMVLANPNNTRTWLTAKFMYTWTFLWISHAWVWERADKEPTLTSSSGSKLAMILYASFFSLLCFANAWGYTETKEPQYFGEQMKSSLNRPTHGYSRQRQHGLAQVPVQVGILISFVTTHHGHTQHTHGHTQHNTYSTHAWA